MFCKSQNVNIRTTYMDDGLIVWREFENCITFIGAAKGITEEVLSNLLEYAFNALIFCISLSELKHNKNVEQLKRELKVSWLFAKVFSIKVPLVSIVLNSRIKILHDLIPK